MHLMNNSRTDETVKRYPIGRPNGADAQDSTVAKPCANLEENYTKAEATKPRIALNNDEMLIHECLDLWAPASSTLLRAYYCMQGIRNWVIIFRNDYTPKA